MARLLNFNYSLPFILFQVILISLAKERTVFGFTNETDLQALFAVKDLITGDPFSVLSSWNLSLHFCNWRGVTCNHRRQRVTMLDLSSLNLAGPLSPYIGNLTFLKVIYLQNNSFHGTVPQEIGQLYRLQYLYLVNNSFKGNFPTNFSHCLNLRVLNLNRNNFEGNIPNELGSLSNLIHLVLSTNNFTGPIPPSIGNLSSLRTLSVGTNNLVGNIPWKLSLLSNLEYINLSENNLSGMVPSALYNISSIHTFALNNNLLEGNLPPDIGLTLPNLTIFFIYINNFSGSFPPSIGNASGLVQFDIGLNNFIGPLPTNLGSLQNLERLYLYRNKLGTSQPSDLYFLIQSLINCTNLLSLDIGENGFIGELPYSIVNLSTTLKELVLGSNYISGSIPREIGNLVNMGRLGLFENMLEGSIPRSIGKMSKLEAFSLTANKISGEIPTSIGNITRLDILTLQRNMLEGSIPIVLGNLTNLLILILGSNRLTGVIPEQIVGVTSMINVLRLDQNQLSGALPLNIGSMKNLDEFDISGNRLTGEIPSTLGNCLMLEFLYLHDNHFRGAIPSSFSQLKSIQVMDLSYNNFSGHIPSFLGDLGLIRVLNLSHNVFIGEVPKKGVFRNITKFSIVGNLKLCGGIQALQLPACPMKESKKRKPSFSRRIIPVLIILPIVILLVCLAIILYRLGRSKEKMSSESVLQDQYPKLSYRELLQATNGFSATNLIGEGRYGSVYKGILNVGEQVIAVKVLNLELHGAYLSFLTECEAYRNILHRNLVKIITSCSSIDFKGSDFKALVLEFMPKGSLDNWLHPSLSEQENNKRLTLLQRLSIAIGVASALDYLHHHCEKRIIHCDLKPSNILLDEEFDAHVGDFGLSRILSDTTCDQNTNSIGIRGTIGYVPPEYGMGDEVSLEGDVYSYGILLLEMFTGKSPTDNMFTESFSLCNYVRNAIPQKVMEIVDPRIIIEREDGLTRTQANSTNNIMKMEVCLMSILQIGILCCAERPRERMDMRDVLRDLTVTRNLFVGVIRETN